MRWGARRSVKEHGLERASIEAIWRKKGHFCVLISSHISLLANNGKGRRSLPVRIASMHRLRVLSCLMHNLGFLAAA